MENILSRKSSETEPQIAQTDDDGVAEENCPVDPLPHEIVLSFDHILEQIFNSLDIPDLLACRLVSHRYLKIALRPLGERIRKTFYCGDSTAEFERFIEVLEQPALSSETNSNRILFLCTKFRIFGIELENEILQKFLNINGRSVRSLEIYSLHESPVGENALMEKLTNLLTIQAPQLEKLSVRAFVNAQWPQAVMDSVIYRHLSKVNNCPLLNTSPEFEQISSRVESLPRKSNLKVLEIYGRSLTHTIEFLLQLSPKLQQIVVENSHYPHLLHPVNRVHLLKCLSIIPEKLRPNSLQEDPEFMVYVGVLEKISLDKNLILQKLTIHFGSAPRELYDSGHEFQNKVVSMINRLLEGSKETLEILHLTSFTFLPGIKIPSPMSRVQQIEIREFDANDIRNYGAVFPIGFSLIEVFPNLTSVKLGYFHACYTDRFFTQFLQRLGFAGDGVEALSVGVKKLILVTETNLDLTTVPLFFTGIQKLFPNASIEFTRL